MVVSLVEVSIELAQQPSLSISLRLHYNYRFGSGDTAPMPLIHFPDDFVFLSQIFIWLSCPRGISYQLVPNGL